MEDSQHSRHAQVLPKRCSVAAGGALGHRSGAFAAPGGRFSTERAGSERLPWRKADKHARAVARLSPPRPDPRAHEGHSSAIGIMVMSLKSARRIT